jgi:hypothetical protein
MTEQLTEQQALARADHLIADIDYAERAGLSRDMVDRLYRMFDRLDAKAIAAGFGPL